MVHIHKKNSVGNKLLVILVALLIIGSIIWWVNSSIRENHLMQDPMLHKLKNILDPLHLEVKNLKLYKGKKSYTINKKKIYMCLKDKNNEYYSENMLIYVLIHEFAHYLNKDDIGHTEKFHIIFENLLKKADAMGLYDRSIPLDTEYCMHNKDE
jgi:hypothetical protein